MICSAQEFATVLGRVSSYGSSKIETNNILLYRRPEDDRLIFGVASRTTLLTVISQFTVAETDILQIKTAIAVNEKTLTAIVTGMGKNELVIETNSENESFIKLSTSKETYDLSYSVPSQEDVDKIFKVDESGSSTLFKDVPILNLKHLSTVVSNIGILCTDNQYRSIIHRKGTELKCIFLTGTTLNIAKVGLPANEEYDEDNDYGLDTTSSFLTRALAQVISFMKKEQLLTVKYNSNSAFFSSDDMLMQTAFDSKSDDISNSIQIYYNLKDIIEMSQANVLNIALPGKELEETINKASIVLSKSAVNRLDSYIPLFISNDSSVKLEAKSTAGSYSTSIDEEVTIEGLPDKYVADSVTYNMNIPMMKAMLGALNKTYKGRIKIELRDTIENKTYVSIQNEKDDGISYYIRLRR